MRYTTYIDRIFCRMFKSCVVCKQIKMGDKYDFIYTAQQNNR